MSDFNQNINASETYAPTPELSAKAHVKSMEEYQRMYKASIEDAESFWGEMAKQFHWQTPFEKVGPEFNFDRSKGPVSVKWFQGGKTNLSYNCLDRNVQEGNGDKPAMYHEGNDVDDVHASFTYSQLLVKVCQLANALKEEGVKKGDRVSVYLPMVAELPSAMLACARLGAVHSVVFGGFSAESLAGRIIDAQSSVVITADGVMRGAKPVQLKAITDKACELTSQGGFEVRRVVCVARLKGTARGDQAKHSWAEGRDVWYSDFVGKQAETCECEWMDSEDPLFMLYTSGSTGKPKGVLHTTGGYMLSSFATMKYTFDYHPEDVYFCTADCGWITGHSYVTYGPMLNAATQVLFEGVPTYPEVDRFWKVCEKYKVSIFYTAPTAIRSLMKSGDEPVTRNDLSSLRLLGSVGEPINPEAWKWYHRVVGGGRCAIADTYWQTETGSHLITPLVGAMTCKPGSASLPFFGVEPAILDENGKEQEGECSGRLVLKRPMPSMMRTVYGDHQRFEETYFSQFNGYYFTGDGCKRDKDGYYWLTGRMDDVINVSGHRIGTAEVESALVAHSKVAEAAVVGFPHDIKGEGIWCYITLNEGVAYDDALKAELKKQVREVIGAFAQPDEIHWAPGLPKTRSGKIMRRVLRKLALPDFETQDLGDTSTLADPSVVEVLKSYHPRKKSDGGYKVLTETAQRYESEKVQGEVEIADVKDMLNAKRTEEERETRRRDRLESELIELRQTMEARERTLRQVKAEIKQQEEVKATTESQLNVQRQIIENKKQEEANWQRQIGELKRQKQDGSDAKKKLTEENNELDKELKAKFEEIRTSTAERDKTKKSLDLLKRRKALDDEERHEMNLAKAVLKTEAENLIREIEMLKKQAETDSKTIADILRDRESLNRALIRCDDRTKDQSKKVKTHDDEAQQLEEEVKQVKLDVQDAIKQAYDLDKTREKYGLECSLANSKYMAALEASSLTRLVYFQACIVPGAQESRQ
ncbi:unnamed protein product [Effrenium voratum]|uniref:acetate--CoA ligase n=1 Tax=Effrenium voratum TaxID=2562239 RepID=A0AA36J1H9_9DINO|nr:unnamed protein product [Effrenium voratum]